MPAYDMQQGERSAPWLHLDPGLRHTHRRKKLRPPVATAAATDRLSITDASFIDSVLDRLADRLAAAVVARLGTDQVAQQDEWLDSRQAAHYLGLHRDTLRRLAAARAIPSEQDGRGCKLFFRRVALDEWRRSGGRSRHLAVVAGAA